MDVSRDDDPCEGATDHNGWETYVAAKMADKDTSFMPSNTAIVLEASAEEDGAALEALKERVEGVEEQGKRMLKMLEKMTRDQSLILETLANSQ